MPSEKSLKLARGFIRSGLGYDPVEHSREIGLLAIEFEALLPAGAVAVDQEKLREALWSWTGWCNWPDCEAGTHSPGTPHSSDCPLGGDDA